MTEPSNAAENDRGQPSLAAGVASSGLWSVSGQAAQLGMTIVTAPFIIRLLGPAKYGLWALIQTLGTYFIVADLGMATASTRFAAERYAHDDSEGESTVIWTSLATTVSITGVFCVAMAIAAPFVVIHVLHVRGPLRSEGTEAVRLLVIGILAYAAAGCLNTPQQVRLKWRTVTFVTSGPTLARMALAPILLVTIGGGVVTLTALMAAGMVLTAVLNFAASSRLLPALRRPHATRPVFKQMARYGGLLAVSTFITVPLTSAERFFLAGFHSSVSVAYYAVAASLASLLSVFPFAFTVPLIPALTRHLAVGNLAEHRRLYQLVLRATFLCVTPLALGLAFLGHPFLSLWAGPRYGTHSSVPFYILLAGLWFNTLGYVPQSHLIASGGVSRLAILRSAELVPYLLLAAVLTARFGVIGAAMAWSIRIVVDVVLLFGIVLREAGLSWIPTPKRGIASVASAGLLVMAVIGLSAVTTSLVARAIWTVVVLSAYGFGTWQIILTPRERAQVKRLGTDMRSRRAGATVHESVSGA
jgi:O-antigen/teichoic acid export membrane protein